MTGIDLSKQLHEPVTIYIAIEKSMPKVLGLDCGEQLGPNDDMRTFGSAYLCRAEVPHNIGAEPLLTRRRYALTERL